MARAEPLPQARGASWPEPLARRVEWVHELLLDRRRGAALLLAAFLLLAVTLAVNLTFLNDEGVFTFIFGRGLWKEFWAFLFVHKGKPVNMLLEAVPARFGFRAFLVGHVVLSAAAIWLTCSAARALGIRHPNVAGWFLATSAVFAMAASNGYPNVIAATVIALFLFLYYSGRRAPAALVLGLLPLSRYELVLVVLAYLAIDFVRHRDFRFVALTTLFPAVYVAAGAVYAGDPFWIAKTLVDPNSMPNEFKDWRHGVAARELAQLLGRSIVANSPFLAAFAALGFRRGNERAREVSFVMLGFYGILTIVQTTEIQKFALQLRHHLAALPLVGIAVAYGLSQAGPMWRSLSRSTRPSGAGTRRPSPGLLLRLGFLTLAVGFLGYQLAFGLQEDRSQHLGTHALMSELTRRGEFTGQVVYSDIFTAEQDSCAGFRAARLLVNPQIAWELRAATKPRAEQWPAVVRALESEGWVFDPEQLEIDEGAIYLLSRKTRNAAWSERLRRAGLTTVDVEGFDLWLPPRGHGPDAGSSPRSVSASPAR